MPRFWSSRPKQRAWLARFCIGKGLDVGCGYKKISEESLGVDVLKQDPRCVAEIWASAENLSMLADAKWDYIVSCQTLEHLINIKETLKEWFRVLKLGGKVAVSVPDAEREERAVKDAHHSTAFTKQTLTWFFEATGFEILETELMEEAGWPTILLAAQKPLTSS